MIAEIRYENLLLGVFSAGYMDYGLRICREDGGEWPEVFYNPHYLSSDCWGHHHEDDDGVPLSEGVPWTADEWREALLEQADDIIEGAVGWST